MIHILQLQPLGNLLCEKSPTTMPPHAAFPIVSSRSSARLPRDTAQSKPHLYVMVTLAPTVADKAVSGRLLIFMSSKLDSPLYPTWGGNPQDLWIAAREIPNLTPGDSVDLDTEDGAFPQPFSKAPPGQYRLRAVLDTNHTYAYVENEDDGDLRSEVSLQQLPATKLAVTLTSE
jgi:hypothetical protein